MSSETSRNETSRNGAVTLPIEEVLRLTTVQHDEAETEIEIETDSKRIASRAESNSPNGKRRKSKSSSKAGISCANVGFERKTPSRTRSGSSTCSRGSRKLQKAVKNEKKSVDKLVAAAIRKYEEASPSEKTRTAPGRTRSGSSTDSRRRSPKRRGRKKRGSRSTASPPREQQQQQQQHQESRVAHEPATEESPVPTEIDDAGAIAVYPSESDRNTTRRDRSAPHRISDISTNFATNSTGFLIDEEAQNDRRDSFLDVYEEEVPEPPQSQVIHAVATMRRGVSDSETLTTAPTIATDPGTVTARAVSSEDYYQEVRRQLEKEAIAAVAVIPLAEDGKPMKQKRSLHGSSAPDDSSENLEKDGRRRKKVWVSCALVLAVVLGLAIGIGVAVRAVHTRRARNSDSDSNSNSNSNSPATDVPCSEDMECFMDSMNTMMNSEAGQYWRERITRILPHSTLVTILEDGTFTSPQFRAFDYLVSNSEMLFGFSMNEMMEMDMVEDFTPRQLARVKTIFGLVTLYYSMNGSDWYVQTNWLQPQIDVCDWHGVECLGDDRSTDLLNRPLVNNQGSQPFANLNNPPPGALDDDTLTRETTIVDDAFGLDESSGYVDDQLLFHSLVLMANNLSGSIPEEIGLLSTIYGQINLSRNNIQGSIPSALGQLSRLQGLRLDSNDLASTLPDLANMEKLKVFDIRDNQSIGGSVLPFENWSGIEVLRLENTDLTGTVPTEMCEMLQNREPSFEPTIVGEFIFSASCGLLECPCCTVCCYNNNDEDGLQCSPKT